MSIRLGPSVQAKINQRVESGQYPDAASVVEEALRSLDARERKAELHALLQVALDQVDRGEIIEMDDDFWPNIMREADEEDRLGIPIPDHVKP